MTFLAAVEVPVLDAVSHSFAGRDLGRTAVAHLVADQYPELASSVVR